MDWSAMVLSLRLATTVSAILLLLGVPIAYWLTFSGWRWKFLLEVVVSMRLVLLASVLGFYVLVASGNRSTVGRLWLDVFGTPLAFSFEALVIDSILYSLPFAVQPVAASFALV